MNFAVLIVDDEPLVRELLAEMLSGMSLVIFEAADSRDALEILEKRAYQVAILITDVRMPGELDGLDLANVVQKSWPWIRVIVMSGHYETGPDRLPRNARYLTKPWQSHEMVENVTRLHPSSTQCRPVSDGKLNTFLDTAFGVSTLHLR